MTVCDIDSALGEVVFENVSLTTFEDMQEYMPVISLELGSGRIIDHKMRDRQEKTGKDFLTLATFFGGKVRKIFAEGQKDHSRPLPGQPMATVAQVRSTVEKVGFDHAAILAVESQEVKLALAHLRSVGLDIMAAHLEAIAKAGLIRAGPFEGFLAAVYTLNDDQEAIVLTDNHPVHNDLFERAASLIHEVGATAEFNLTDEVNEARAKAFLGFVAIVGLEIAKRIHNREYKEAESLKAKTTRDKRTTISLPTSFYRHHSKSSSTVL